MGLGGYGVEKGSGGLPRADFRLKGDALDPLAPVKVLAVMCHPADARGREGMLRSLPNRITIPRGGDGAEAPGDLWLQDIWDEFLAFHSVGGRAGAVVLAMSQVRMLNRPAEPASVRALAAGIAQQWEQSLDLEPSPAARQRAAGRAETDLFAAFRAFAAVSHLWAALVYGTLRKLPGIQPQSTQTLPTFLAYGEEIARLAVGVSWVPRTAELGLDPQQLWTFELPERLRKTARAQLAPTPTVAASVPTRVAVAPHHPFDRRGEGERQDDGRQQDGAHNPPP